MILDARYVHTNLVAHDWRALVDFYVNLFGCTVAPPERDYSGPQLDAGTGLAGVRLRGVHLRLPGYGEEGPTLEIYSYSTQHGEPTTDRAGHKAINRPGYGHIAFAVPDVAAAHAAVLAAGGSPVGEVVTLTTSSGASVTWCYVTDPEGNAIELQAWA